MKIRSITMFAPTIPEDETELAPLVAFGAASRAAFEAGGFEVQTVRLATPPWSRRYTDAGEAVAVARWLDKAAPAAGIGYVSLGPVEVGVGAEAIAASTALLATTENIFCSVLVGNKAQGMDQAAIRATARVIQANATLEPNGFGNLRFAALANVGPGSPFFPAAYSDPTGNGSLSFALALQSADLAVEAYAGAASLDAAQAALIARLEASAAGLVPIAEALAAEHGVTFGGLDFSLAPFPDAAHSSAGAIESLGAAPFGAAGTLAIAAMTTEALRTARYPRCGFSGLMLPVLEDTTLAARSGEGSYTLHSLLLFSAVCGTGLDTVPLPGDISADTLAALLLDVTALALRLDKPLTARLMPIPGKQAGERTTFDFPFFANGTILSTAGSGC